jgi:hypothetical protein
MTEVAMPLAVNARTRRYKAPCVAGDVGTFVTPTSRYRKAQVQVFLDFAPTTFRDRLEPHYCPRLPTGGVARSAAGDMHAFEILRFAIDPH